MNPMKSNHAQRELALAIALSGLPVFPVNPRNKRPCNAHGHLEATTDAAQIRAWWSRWPNALVAIPTGEPSGIWVVDADGEAGRQSLNDYLLRTGLERPSDLSDVIGETPGCGLHVYFEVGPGERPRTRAGDIAAGLDTRGNGGYIIAPGNYLPDGRQYRSIGPARYLLEARPAPRELVFLATFNARERAEIAAEPNMRAAIREAAPAEWSGIIEAHRQAKAHRIAERCAGTSPDAMRRQALFDLHQAAGNYACLRDGRRNGLFTVACRLVCYVVNNVLSEAEFRHALRSAADANGAIGVHGSAWFDGVLRRALACGARDPLPPLARRFREAS